MVKPRKKVLHFIESEGVYGAERVILNLSKEMLQSTEIEPVVGCIVNKSEDVSDLFDAARNLGIEAIKLPISNSKVILDLFKAAKILRSARIAIIHSHGYKPSVYGAFLAVLLKIPVIATCHLWFEPSKGPLKMRFMLWLERHAYLRFPKILAVSESIRQTLLGNGVAPARVQVIPNGVDLVFNAESAEASKRLRDELSLREDDYCVLSAGRLARQKAQWVIVEAAAILKAAGQPCQFLIVGEGGLKASLQEMIKARGVEDCVKLLGFRSDMQQLLDVADLFVLPSLDEGMPMSLLEAACAKVPVVATPVGDIPKLLEHERSGLIVPLENPQALAERINRLKSNRAFAQTLADEAYLRVRALYSSQAMCEQYIKVYNEVLS